MLSYALIVACLAGSMLLFVRAAYVVNRRRASRPGTAVATIPEPPRIKTFPLYNVHYAPERPSSGGHVGPDGWWVEE